MSTRLTELAVATSPGRWRCGVCQWHCELGEAETGRCLVRAGSAEGIVALNHALVSAAQVGPIEDHRLWHFFPGTPVLSVGSWGYAFPADQQHGQYARIPEDPDRRRELEPERVAMVALERLCRGVIWSYSDPSVSQEYVLDVLRTARASSRYTGLVTSGYATIAAVDQYGHYLDGISLELRAFDESAYRRLAGINEWQGILEAAVHAHTRWGCHMEVVTRLHPGVNDNSEQIMALANWIAEALGDYTPWHILPGDAGTAAAAAVVRARKLARDVGLFYVYGNDAGQSTSCPSCHALIADRSATRVKIVGLDGDRCSSCGANLHFRTSIFKRAS
jgi:pyruvate formate lyase activating enzyme